MAKGEFEHNVTYYLYHNSPTPQVFEQYSMKKILTLYSIVTHFHASTIDSFGNIVGKGEIARDEQFLLFPKCFLLNQIIVSPFFHIFDIIFLCATEFEEPKFGISGKGLMPLQKVWTQVSMIQAKTFSKWSIFCKSRTIMYIWILSIVLDQ